MKDHISNATFSTELLDLLDETFARTQGIYLDRGHSLFETLERISAEKASCPISEGDVTIASHVEHICYYITVLESSIQLREFGEVDWDQSWRLRKVNSVQWEDLKQRVRESYRDLVSTIRGVDEWKGEDDIGGSLAILAHTAYHLGAIKQILKKIDQ